jgi:hypothetical protein
MECSIVPSIKVFGTVYTVPEPCAFGSLVVSGRSRSKHLQCAMHIGSTVHARISVFGPGPQAQVRGLELAARFAIVMLAV